MKVRYRIRPTPTCYYLEKKYGWIPIWFFVALSSFRDTLKEKHAKLKEGIEYL